MAAGFPPRERRDRGEALRLLSSPAATATPCHHPPAAMKCGVPLHCCQVPAGRSSLAMRACSARTAAWETQPSDSPKEEPQPESQQRLQMRLHSYAWPDSSCCLPEASPLRHPFPVRCQHLQPKAMPATAPAGPIDLRPANKAAGGRIANVRMSVQSLVRNRVVGLETWLAEHSQQTIALLIVWLFHSWFSRRISNLVAPASATPAMRIGAAPNVAIKNEPGTFASNLGRTGCSMRRHRSGLGVHVPYRPCGQDVCCSSCPRRHDPWLRCLPEHLLGQDKRLLLLTREQRNHARRRPSTAADSHSQRANRPRCRKQMAQTLKHRGAGSPGYPS